MSSRKYIFTLTVHEEAQEGDGYGRFEVSNSDNDVLEGEWALTGEDEGPGVDLSYSDLQDAFLYVHELLEDGVARALGAQGHYG